MDSLFTLELDGEFIVKHDDIPREGIIGNYVRGKELNNDQILHNDIVEAGELIFEMINKLN